MKFRSFACVLALAVCRPGLSQDFGPHPRLFSEPQTTTALQSLAGRRSSFVAATIDRCREVTGASNQYAIDGYMGLDWAQHLQSCLIAWRATGNEAFAKTSFRYFLALIDDLKTIGDGLGGDKAATRDSGYAIRAEGPYSALAYDWLHDHPLMTEEVRARARSRFKAWTDWYLANGYRARSPGTNYHAGYVFAATLIAIAQAGDAGEDGERLWAHVRGTIFERDLLPAAESGVLRGGDWGEGWQYAPLSVASYALSARAVASHGVDVEPLGRWLQDIALRHFHAATPAGDDTYVGGDTQAETPNLPVRRETLAAVVAGPAPLEAKQWAQAELDRLGSRLGPPTFSLFGALAEAEQVKAVPFPRDQHKPGFLAAGTSTLYWRSSWKPSAVWFVSPCSRQIDVDHIHPNAGNFILSRGGDHLIVDPSPYGTLSSLTSNAPTVFSTVLPPDYVPSQAFWGEQTGFRWLARLAGGELAVRCDYADQYRIQETPSDVPYAVRDFVVLPYPDTGGRESAAVFVIDRVRGRDSRHALHLRFRTTASIKATAAAASGRLGGSALTIARLTTTSEQMDVKPKPRGSCFEGSYTRGNCDAARFAVNEVRLEMPGPNADAVHFIEANPTGRAGVPPVELSAQGGAAWQLQRGGREWVVAIAEGNTPLTIESRPGTHVALPFEPGGTKRTQVSAREVQSGCAVTIGGDSGVAVPGAPAVFSIDAACHVTAVAADPVSVPDAQ